jgi:hypothetical protein
MINQEGIFEDEDMAYVKVLSGIHWSYSESHEALQVGLLDCNNLN